MKKLMSALIAVIAAGMAYASGPTATAVKVPSRAYQHVTFYESFEDYKESYGLNWIPEGWSKICTDAHKPTEESLSHNVNNTWYATVSFDYGPLLEKTPDGENEMFIHFGYEDIEKGSSNAPQDEWLISPEFAIGDNEELSFYLESDYSYVYLWDYDMNMFKDRSDVQNTLKVMVSTDGGATWDEAWDLEADVVSEIPDAVCWNKYGNMMYHHYTTSLAKYANQNIKLGFRYIRKEGEFTGCSMALDGVTVKPAETVEAPDREGWTLLGTGSMADGWVLPALTKNPSEFYDPQDYIFAVDIYEKDGQPGMFLLASPWTSENFPFVDLNGNKTRLYDIIIDATDPGFVIVEPQISGFEHNNPEFKAERYASPYYISHAGKQYLDEGYSKAEITSYGHNATYDASTGVINIKEPKYGHSTSDAVYIPSGFGASHYPSVIYLPNGDTPAPVWNALGEATFIDGFLYPGFAGDPENAGWKVEIEEKVDQPGYYRIIAPYTCANSPMKKFNSNTKAANIIIDATDPELVVMTPQYSGFSGYNSNELWNYYIGNDAGYQMFANGVTKEQIKAVVPETRRDMLVDGVITFKEPLFGKYNIDFGYKWTDKSGETLTYPGKLIIPSSGIASAESDADAPEAWYTIAGVRLAGEPSAAGLYIRVKGSKAEKIIK